MIVVIEEGVLNGSLRRLGFLVAWLALLLLVVVVPCHAQGPSPIPLSPSGEASRPEATPSSLPSGAPETPPSPSAAPSSAAPVEAPSPSSSASPVATPVPLPYVVAQSEAVTRALREIQDDLDSDAVTDEVEHSLPDITVEITDLLTQTRGVVSKGASLAVLRRIEADWEQVFGVFPSWSRSLTARATQLESELSRLDELSTTWKNTAVEAQAADTPPEVLDRIHAVLLQIDAMRKLVDARRAQVLALQTRVSAQAGRGLEAQTLLNKARAESASLLLVQDSAHLWSPNAYHSESLAREVSDDWATIYRATAAYTHRNGSRFLVHGVGVVVLALLILRARNRLAEQVAEEPQCEGILAIFRVPFATGFLLTVFFTDFIYPRTPRLLDAGLSIAVVIATARVIQQVLAGPLLPLVRPLFAFYVIDMVRHTVITVPIVIRFVFLAEMVAATAYAFTAYRVARTKVDADAEATIQWRLVLWIARICGVVFAFSAVANAMGYVGLSRFVGDVLLNALYLALIMFGLERVFEGVIIALMRVRPLSSLSMVANHRALFRGRLRTVLSVLGLLFWGYVILDGLTLRRAVFDLVERALNAGFNIGGAQVSLGGVLLFVIVLWGSFALSKVIMFILDEDVYPRVTLARGLPYAISTLIHYLVLLGGFFVGLSVLGIDMTKFTIVVGAFSVGLGFGMQNVVSNFVSGLILLFERPANVGDMLEVAGHLGELRHIGLRASVIRVTDGSEVIVPNSLLTSQQVVNWTLSDQRRRIELELPVGYDCDPAKVVKIMLEVAAQHPDVLKHPAPQALLTALGPKDMKFELRLWTQHYAGASVLRSALNLNLVSALRNNGIRITADMIIDPPPPPDVVPVT